LTATCDVDVLESCSATRHRGPRTECMSPSVKQETRRYIVGEDRRPVQSGVETSPVGVRHLRREARAATIHPSPARGPDRCARARARDRRYHCRCRRAATVTTQTTWRRDWSVSRFAWHKTSWRLMTSHRPVSPQGPGVPAVTVQTSVDSDPDKRAARATVVVHSPVSR
jgi:hypothetical protein